jgi:hypothetical protein
MPIADGEPADDGDVWFRVLTEDGYIRKGKLHPHAFKGRAIAPPDNTKKRLWSHELSGQLRSLTTDVNAEAQAYCDQISRITKQQKTFSGVMYCSIPDARQTFHSKVSTQVYYTPQPAKKAHADFTFTESADADEAFLDKLRLWLCEILTGLHTAQIKLLPQATTTAAEYTAPNRAAE